VNSPGKGSSPGDIGHRWRCFNEAPVNSPGKELTAVQYADLEREAARVYRDIEPRYLTEAPATVLLNSHVQKHWRTLVGK